MQSLNGKWDAIVDLYDQGRKNKIYLNRKPEGKTDFYEYSFDNGLRLDVPSDWNCQMPELKYYEGTVWYARRFDAPKQTGRRQLFVMDDPFIGELDVVAINKYMGWYHPWPLTPDKAVWDVARGKPLIISEFGGEALYGQHGPADVASSWSEEYQEALYRDNLRMFENIPNLRGVSPWILFDFRSPFRFHPANQEGWNRKGLVSDQGYRKKAWYLMKAYYDKIKRR